MNPEIHSTFVNYYEILEIPEDAATSQVKDALATYRVKQEALINNPLYMSSARIAINETIPAIERTLLADGETRRTYNAQLAEFKRKQQMHDEPADHEGLDEPLRVPFLFDPFESFDTELPAFTLRAIASKLDNEWAEARAWITDTSDETHSFISYLNFVANRKHLADRIGEIIQAVSRKNGPPIDTNEAIERCITILDPRIERPRVSIHNATFDGKRLDAGTFVSDQPAQIELLLAHEGVRGCVFGTLESRTDWIKFEKGQTVVPFVLMPSDTPTGAGISELKIPLYFIIGSFARNKQHSGWVVLRLANWESVVEIPVQVMLFIQPLPPRVLFDEISVEKACQAPTVRRGVPVSIVVTPRNRGDEALLPLEGNITARDNASAARPMLFHANEPITLTVNTGQRAYGASYTVPFPIRYVTPGATGPQEIYVRGEILPTVWQSLLRIKHVGERLATACGAGLLGAFIFGAIAEGLTNHIPAVWLLVIALPLLCILGIRIVISTIVLHKQRAGHRQVPIGEITPIIVWGIPLALGLLIALICSLISDLGASTLIGAIAGLLLGSLAGFCLDAAGSEATRSAG